MASISASLSELMVMSRMFASVGGGNMQPAHKDSQQENA
jgi:hypothetical protein